MKRKSMNNDNMPSTPTIRPRKSRAKRLPGLKMALPASAGPWLKKCVERWHLVAPFDLSVTEAAWQKYYKERAALDWFTLANGLSQRKRPMPTKNEMEYCPIDVAEPRTNLPAWTEDFPKPKLIAYPGGESACGTTDFVSYHIKSLHTAIKKVLDDCPEFTKLGASEDEDIAEKLASGIYVLNGESCWVDYNECTDFNICTRLYSPFGLGTSIDFELDWHREERLYSPEHFSTAQFAIRSASHCSPSKPTTSALDRKEVPKPREPMAFMMEEMAWGRYNIHKMGPEELHLAQRALFGYENLLSDRKMFSLLLHSIADVSVKVVNKDLSRIDTQIHSSYRSVNEFLASCLDVD
jgi:hypothetical protein